LPYTTHIRTPALQSDESRGSHSNLLAARQVLTQTVKPRWRTPCRPDAGPGAPQPAPEAGLPARSDGKAGPSVARHRRLRLAIGATGRRRLRHSPASCVLPLTSSGLSLYAAA